MSKIMTNKQRQALYDDRGVPVLALEFDCFSDNKVSMWAHTRHEIPFEQMKKAFIAIRDHINEFIDDEKMCPFNPNFKGPE